MLKILLAVVVVYLVGSGVLMFTDRCTLKRYQGRILGALLLGIAAWAIYFYFL